MNIEEQSKIGLIRELYALRFFAEGGFSVYNIGFTDDGKDVDFTSLPDVYVSDELSECIIDALKKRCKDIEAELQKDEGDKVQ